MALISLLLAPAMALAPADEKSDAQCVAVLMQMVDQVSDADGKGKATAGMMYFLGKLAASHTTAQIKSLTDAARATTPLGEMSAIGQRCGQEIIDLGNALGG